MASLLLKMIIQQLNHYIRSVTEPELLEAGKEVVVMGNIAESNIAGGAKDDLNDRVVVSLVNISEEASLKNNHSSRLVNQQHIKLHPVVHVNLYLLFTSNFNEYEIAVSYLFRVLEFFQGRKIFKFKNAPLPGVNDEEKKRLSEIELTIELHTLSFEQLNDLWGSLGGKQLPFVLYRARLVPVQMELPVSREDLITEIDLASNHYN